MSEENSPKEEAGKFGTKNSQTCSFLVAEFPKYDSQRRELMPEPKGKRERKVEEYMPVVQFCHVQIIHRLI